MLDKDMRVEFLIQPNAKRTEFIGVHDSKIKIKVGAKPIDDSANEELVKFLSKKLSVARSKITIAHGSKGRNKLIDIDTELTVDEIVTALRK